MKYESTYYYNCHVFLIEVIIMEKVNFFINVDEIEQAALDQIQELNANENVYKVAIMPDVHAGNGACVGSVILTKVVVFPQAVGVDLGCGMLAVKLNKKRKDFEGLEEHLLEKIYAKVPVGFAKKQDFSENISFVRRLQEMMDHLLFRFPNSFLSQLEDNWKYQLGTLGGGNHFIELSKDQNDDVWLMIHTGSRGVGHFLASHYIKLAKEKRPEEKLPFLNEDDIEFFEYLDVVNWCQYFAELNRAAILSDVLEVIESEIGHFECLEYVECAHNYITCEEHDGDIYYVTRKGAIFAGKDVDGIIPGAMGAKSFITRGLGCAKAFNSASHGAGRKMSRGDARKTFSKEDVEKSMVGIAFKNSKEVVDEIKDAYKDVDKVMEYQKECVEVKYVLNQFLNVKG